MGKTSWFWLPLVLLFFGCARPWPEASAHRSEHYLVFSNDSPQTAAAIAELMESTYTRCSTLLGPPVTPRPELRVNAYASRSQYRSLARRLDITDLSTGLYSPLPPAAIHLPAQAPLTGQMVATLRHEGLHQFVDQCFCPETNNAKHSSQPLRLLCLPLWLNEGLAMEMEDSAQHSRYLKTLHALIREGRAPALHRVLSRRYGEPFDAADYAVAWGLVHVLVDQHPRQFQQFLQQSRHISTSGLAAHLAPDLPTDERYRRWFDHLAHQSLSLFEQLFAPLPQWERDWQTSIMALSY